MNLVLDIIIENIRILCYMFSVVFSGYMVTEFNSKFLLKFRHPLFQFMIGTFLAMSMIDFRRYDIMTNLINLITSSILFVIMMYILKLISSKMAENENEIAN
jgi:hypothetical protein